MTPRELAAATFGARTYIEAGDGRGLPATGTDAGISAPRRLVAVTHATYDHDRAQFHNLPQDWSTDGLLFGVTLGACPKRNVEGYGRVPEVLMMLASEFRRNKGATTEGVFRVAPDRSLAEACKASIERGAFTGTDDPHIAALLIKRWFRDLKPPLLSCVPRERLEALKTSPTAPALEALVESMKPDERALLLWVLDFGLEVAVNEAVTRMSPKNLAIVFAPNMVGGDSIDDENPLLLLTLTQSATQVLTSLYKWRAKMTGVALADP